MLDLKKLERVCNLPTENFRGMGKYDKGGDYILIQRPGATMLAVGHLDSVQKATTFRWNRKNVYSPRLDNRLGVYNKSIAGFEHELHLHKNGDKIECPSCAFDFIPGTKLSHTEIEERLKVTNGLVAKLNIEINKEKEYETEIREYQKMQYC